MFPIIHQTVAAETQHTLKEFHLGAADGSNINSELLYSHDDLCKWGDVRGCVLNNLACLLLL